MTIDPSQLTKIDHVKPTKGFGRIAYYMTGGLLKKEEEHETFCALSILQQINLVMRSVGIENVVRLATDNIVFYEDTEGKQGDLKLALDQFAEKVDPNRIQLFETLNLVLEHDLDDLACMLDIRIKRKHAVGEFPITVTVVGVPRGSSTTEKSAEEARRELEPVFSSQQNYDYFVARQRQNFDAFVENIKKAFNAKMKLDDVQTKSGLNIIRPNTRVTSKDDIRKPSGDDDCDPVFHNHHDSDDTFFLMWIWAELCHDHDIHCADCSIVDSTGQEVLEVGPEGFQAGEGSAMNVEEPFCIPDGTDIQVKANNDFGTELSHTGDASGGWLDSVGGSFDSGSDAGSGCGGSSCGSSCGGCD